MYGIISDPDAKKEAILRLHFNILLEFGRVNIYPRDHICEEKGDGITVFTVHGCDKISIIHDETRSNPSFDISWEGNVKFSSRRHTPRIGLYAVDLFNHPVYPLIILRESGYTKEDKISVVSLESNFITDLKGDYRLGVASMENITVFHFRRNNIIHVFNGNMIHFVIWFTKMEGEKRLRAGIETGIISPGGIYWAFSSDLVGNYLFRVDLNDIPPSYADRFVLPIAKFHAKIRGKYVLFAEEHTIWIIVEGGRLASIQVDSNGIGSLELHDFVECPKDWYGCEYIGNRQFILHHLDPRESTGHRVVCSETPTNKILEIICRKIGVSLPWDLLVYISRLSRTWTKDEYCCDCG